MSFEVDSVASAIESALRLDTELDADAASDIAFHMTDWLDDLEVYSRFCADPGSLSRSQTRDLLMRFLVHVPNHLNAAYRLLMDEPVTDVFGIGAVATDSSPQA